MAKQCSVLTAGGTRCKRDGIHRSKKDSYWICKQHETLITDNFSNLNPNLWKRFPNQILYEFTTFFLEEQNSTVVKQLVNALRPEMITGFYRWDLTKDMIKIFFDAFGPGHLLSGALNPNCYSKHIMGLELGYNPIPFILNDERWGTGKNVTELYSNWIRSVFYFFVYTKAQFLHQKRCGLIVMTLIISYLYSDIVGVFEDGVETSIMENCLIASNERPGTQKFHYTPGSKPFGKIKHIKGV